MRQRVVLSALMICLGLGASARAQGLTATFTTTPAGGGFMPKNVVAVWVQDGGGAFVKTIGRWAATRKNDLVAWTMASGSDADAVSGATRANHNGTLMVSWDLKDRAGQVVPDGTYTIRMELSDSNTSSAANNNQGTFTFVKGTAPQSQNGLTSGGFENVTINYAPNAGCNNGVVDPGETCDPPGSCPTSCATSADACMPNVLVGDAASCTAECVAQPITACMDGDGCCPTGCDTSSDADCATGGGGGGDPGTVNGGCDAGQGQGALLASALVGLAVLGRRRRRR